MFDGSCLFTFSQFSSLKTQFHLACQKLRSLFKNALKTSWLLIPLSPAYFIVFQSSSSPNNKHRTRHKTVNADRKRKFFQRKNTSSAPNSSNENSFDRYSPNGKKTTLQLVTKIRQPFFTGSSIYTTKTRGGCISNNSPQRAGSFSDSAVSRALEEALRTTAIVSWDAAGDCIEEVSPVMTSRASLGSNFEFQQGSLSRSSPSTTNSSPKGGGRPRGKQYSNFRRSSFENV